MAEEIAAHMARYWDARAREHAEYFVDNRLDYRGEAGEAFWTEGAADLDRMLDAVGARVAPGDVVLDVGCGVGRLTRALAARRARARPRRLGRDAHPGPHAPRFHLERLLHLGDGTSLTPLGDASLDAVVSLVVFQHIPDPAVTLGYVREIGRVLRPGGWAAFQVSNDPAVHRVEHPRSRVKEALGRAPKGQDDPAWRGSAVTLDELEQAVVDGGMALAARAGETTQFLVVRTVKV